MTAVLVVGFVATAVVGGVLRHVLVTALARGLDVANLLGCSLAGVAVGAGIDGSARTIVLAAGCGSLTSLSGIVADGRHTRSAAALRIVGGAIVVAAAAAVTRRM